MKKRVVFCILIASEFLNAEFSPRQTKQYAELKKDFLDVRKHIEQGVESRVPHSVALKWGVGALGVITAIFGSVEEKDKKRNTGVVIFLSSFLIPHLTSLIYGKKAFCTWKREEDQQYKAAKRILKGIEEDVKDKKLDKEWQGQEFLHQVKAYRDFFKRSCKKCKE